MIFYVVVVVMLVVVLLVIRLQGFVKIRHPAHGLAKGQHGHQAPYLQQCHHERSCHQALEAKGWDGLGQDGNHVGEGRGANTRDSADQAVDELQTGRQRERRASLTFDFISTAGEKCSVTLEEAMAVHNVSHPGF